MRVERENRWGETFHQVFVIYLPVYINLYVHVIVGILSIYQSILIYIRVGPDIRWPDIDFCRISGYPVSGFFHAGYPVSGKSAGYPVSGHSAGLSGRIFDYFEQKFRIYHFHQLL